MAWNPRNAPCLGQTKGGEVMSERTDADNIAEGLCNDPIPLNPYLISRDVVLMLARQLLRRREIIERLENRLEESLDPTADLINANRDAILKIYEEGIRRIGKLVTHQGNRSDSEKMLSIDKILHAVNTFHPMHGESFSWPE